ncbi:hypothetical protein C0992_004761, partial [Termitomyces sp. T32_za158]
MADFFETLDYHAVSVEELCAMFGTAVDHGLDNVAAAHNIQRYGKNIIAKKKPKPYKSFRDLWKSPTKVVQRFMLLFVLGIIFAIFSWRLDRQPIVLSLTILLIIINLCRALFFRFQAWSTSRIMKSILYLMPSECLVIREGRMSRLRIADLAVGDIVVLSAGNTVPADMRLIEASDDLRFDRSVLTGRSEEIEGIVESRGEAFTEARNIALMNTQVTNGRAKGVVVLTGDRTVIGRISKLNNTARKERTIIQEEISRLTSITITVAVLLSVILLSRYSSLLANHQGFITLGETFTLLTSCIASAIPAGISLAVALVESHIARGMRKVSVLPKSLSTIEALGCVTVICSDKTGTLTQNKMSVMSAG